MFAATDVGNLFFSKNDLAWNIDGDFAFWHYDSIRRIRSNVLIAREGHSLGFLIIVHSKHPSTI